MIIYNQGLYSGAHFGLCVVASASGGLLLGPRVWCGCLPVAQWVDLGAAKCVTRLCTSASHPDDLANLHCSAMSCGAAMHHTPLLQGRA